MSLAVAVNTAKGFFSVAPICASTTESVDYATSGNWVRSPAFPMGGCGRLNKGKATAPAGGFSDDTAAIN